jgi:HK97 family phage portal protein
MGFWKRLLGLEAKGDDPTMREAALRGGLPVAHSGARVTAESALYVSTVLACCRVYMNGTAQVPFRLMLETGDKREPAKDKELAKLLSRRPNPWQTSYEFRETITLHAMLTGNAFVFVNRVGIAREIKELIPLDPKSVEVKRKPDLSLEYKVTNEQGASQTFGRDAIWHIRGPSWNSWLGLDIIKLAREAVGLAITLEQSQAQFQKNGAQTSGVLSMKEKLSPERFNFLAAWLDKHLPGGERFGKPLIADDGAMYTARSFSAVDQQLVESRKMQIEEICREFGVMPIMVGYSDKTATYASAEQMFLAHVVHTLSPWYKRLEESADANLLTDEDREAGYYTKFFPNALMRGAAKDRSEFYKNALGDTQRPGYMTRNEVRALEDLNPVDGGDEFPALITKPHPDDGGEKPTGDDDA